MIIVDEAHHIVSPAFSRVLWNTMGAKYRLYLTATPEQVPLRCRLHNNPGVHAAALGTRNPTLES